MLGWLRRIVTGTGGTEERLRAELRAAQAAQERLSRRLHVVERRLDVADQAIREIGLKLARVDGRTSLLNRAADGEAVEGRDPLEG